MASVHIHANSDITEMAKPLEESVQHVASCIEAYLGSFHGCGDKNDIDYASMVWAVTHLAGVISRYSPNEGYANHTIARSPYE